MAREISGSENLLESLVVAAHSKGLKGALEAVSEYIWENYKIRIWFVTTLGRRWSYLAGRMNYEPSSDKIEHIPLSEKVGLVTDGWGMLSNSKSKELVIFLRWLVSSRAEKERV